MLTPAFVLLTLNSLTYLSRDAVLHEHRDRTVFAVVVVTADGASGT